MVSTEVGVIRLRIECGECERRARKSGCRAGLAEGREKEECTGKKVS